MASAGRRRKSTIGASPLDAVVPRGSGPGREDSSEEAPAQVSGQEADLRERGNAASSAVKERLTVHVTAELSNRVKDAVYWTPGLTLARLAERALSAEMERLEAERGEPFPARAEELRGGRPMK